jgi:hypothetical protein
MNTHRMRPPLARIKIAACLAIAFAGVNSANAEVVIKPEDLIGTWEMVAERNPKTGTVIVDASTANRVDAVHAVALDRGRNAARPQRGEGR